jgi:3-dehydroquinate synthase II
MKLLWIKLEGQWEDIKPLVTSSIESEVDVLVIDEDNINKVKELARPPHQYIGSGGREIKVAAEGKEGDIRIVKVNNREDLKTLREGDCVLIEIDSGEKEELAVAAGKIANWVLILAKDWKIIPLENLVAKLKKGKLLTFASNSEEVKLAIGILEKGVEGVVFSPKNASEIKTVKKILMEISRNKIELIPAKLTNIKPIGLGDRVCVDTIAMLNLGEGMLVGSQSNGFFLIHSETLENPYIETRPFRVNAGAVHSYIKVSKDKTKYLSEIKAGDEVLVVNKRGESRVENVGRVKIERRPMILIEAENRGEIITAILQNAETIALVDKQGNAVSVSKLKIGDEVLVNLENGGRHFGIKVEETLVER